MDRQLGTQQIGNWWTEPLWCEIVGESGALTPLERAKRRVRYYLSHYTEFDRHYFASVQTIRDGGGDFRPSEPLIGARWTEGVCIKADLDRAMKMLTRGQYRAIQLCCLGGYSHREAARIMRCTHQCVCGLAGRGVQQIAEILAGEVAENADSRQGM